VTLGIGEIGNVFVGSVPAGSVVLGKVVPGRVPPGTTRPVAAIVTFSSAPLAPVMPTRLASVTVSNGSAISRSWLSGPATTRATLCMNTSSAVVKFRVEISVTVSPLGRVPLLTDSVTSVFLTTPWTMSRLSRTDITTRVRSNNAE
jgi:hypothetical protein